ncbi:MAG: DUF2628 domain-containing protein [Persephonella sp.]|nr:MAG: DUF2628 domain-containing protein [Persephonella sp.]
MITKQLLEEFDEETIKSFVQKNSDYYLIKWKLMAETGSKISWNWPAFFFGIYWMVYRKMYVYALIILIIGLLLSLIPLINIIAGLVVWIGFGMFGNYVYAMHTYKKLKELSLISSNPEDLKKLALQKGGTSVLAVFILIGIFLAIEIIILMLFAVSSNNYYGY